ncbi:hypothetical protein BDR26DRAFT_810118 [Obelidium mucronatum]|nr:hypothetical protein BDR26DRAFT_810118 [Obelidium mucronatum]
MLQHRGTGRVSIIAGRSVHNQRIEQFNLDLRIQVLESFMSIFHQLEGQGELDINNDCELWVLHQVYQPRIQERLDEFVASHNDHKKRMHRYLTPNQVFAVGMVLRNGYSGPGSGLDNALIDNEGVEHFGEDPQGRARAARVPETQFVNDGANHRETQFVNDGANHRPYSRKHRARVSRVKCPLTPAQLLEFTRIWPAKFRVNDGQDGRWT